MITLQEISGYLPYGIYAYDSEQESKTDKIVGIFHNTLDFENWSPINSNIDHYKLVLRPLSDLTKEIEVNGEKFVPIIELAKYLWPDRNNWEYVEFDEVEQIHILQSKIDEGYLQYAIRMDDYMSYKTAQKLMEWHFWLGDQDRFGKDIIDLNTLK